MNRRERKERREPKSLRPLRSLRFLFLLLAFATTAPASDVQFVVVNSSDAPISSIKVRPSGQKLWGPEMLLGHHPLPAGAGDPWLVIDDDIVGAVWDVKLATADGDFTFFALNLGKTPLLTFTAFAELGLWILTPERADEPLPEMAGSERWQDPEAFVDEGDEP